MASKRTAGANVGDLTVEILKQIRDEGRKTNERLDATNQRLDGMNDRLDAMNARLVQHGDAIVRLIGEVHGLNDRFDNFLTGAHRRDHEKKKAG